MTKPKPNPRSSSRSNGRKTTSRSRTTRRKALAPEPDKQPGARAIGPEARQTARVESKQARVIAMLRSPAGMTIEGIMLATKWQQHSVRGFLAGVVRKKLGLNLTSAASEGGRVYRIKDRNRPPVAGARTKRAA